MSIKYYGSKQVVLSNEHYTKAVKCHRPSQYGWRATPAYSVTENTSSFNASLEGMKQLKAKILIQPISHSFL